MDPAHLDTAYAGPGLRYLRLMANRTARAVANDAKVTYSSLSKIENGSTIPRLDTFLRIVQAIPANLAELEAAMLRVHELGLGIEEAPMTDEPRSPDQRIEEAIRKPRVRKEMRRMIEMIGSEGLGDLAERLEAMDQRMASLESQIAENGDNGESPEADETDDDNPPEPSSESKAPETDDD